MPFKPPNLHLASLPENKPSENLSGSGLNKEFFNFTRALCLSTIVQKLHKDNCSVSYKLGWVW